MQLCGQNQIPMWPDSYALVTVLTATKTSHTGGGHTEASTEVTVSITLKDCSCNHMTLLCMWHLYWGVCGCTVEAGMWWSDDMNGFSNALSTENIVIITVTLRKIRHKHKLTWVTSELGTNPPPQKKPKHLCWTFNRLPRCTSTAELSRFTDWCQLWCSRCFKDFEIKEEEVRSKVGSGSIHRGEQTCESWWKVSSHAHEVGDEVLYLLIPDRETNPMQQVSNMSLLVSKYLNVWFEILVSL